MPTQEDIDRFRQLLREHTDRVLAHYQDPLPDFLQGLLAEKIAGLTDPRLASEDAALLYALKGNATIDALRQLLKLEWFESALGVARAYHEDAKRMENLRVFLVEWEAENGPITPEELEQAERTLQLPPSRRR